MSITDTIRSFDLSQYDGWCLELVDELLGIFPSGEILWVEPPDGDLCVGGTDWKYHVAIVLDGIVYDAWNLDVRLPPKEYVEAVFGFAKWEMNPGSKDDD